MKKSLLALVLGAAAVAAATAAEPEWVNAVVVKADAQRSRVTLNHEAIKSLPMEAMTMPFKVRSPALLQGLKPGDKVRFTLANDSGDLTITDIRGVK